MKIKVFVSLFVTMAFLSSCSGRIDRAIAYNEVMVDAYSQVSEKEEALLHAILTYDTLRMDAEYHAFVVQINHSRNRIKNIGAFEDGYDDFFNAAINIIDTYERVAQKEIVEIIDFMPVYYADPENEDLLEVLDNMLLKMDEVLDEAFIGFDLAQQKFAARYSFALY